MTHVVDRRIAELLCSRMCHELVTGIAAINNGVELVTDIDSSVIDEAMELIADSAKQASVRVQFYRMAYGFAGNDALSSISAVKELVDGLVAHEERITATVATGAEIPDLQPGWGKLCLNLFVFAQDCLPRGGRVSLGVENAAEATRIVVRAEGEGARISERFQEGMSDDPTSEAISALNVHAYYTRYLADTIGRGLEHESQSGAVVLGVSL
jgi:histidine phosphotransferase ChpT